MTATLPFLALLAGLGFGVRQLPDSVLLPSYLVTVMLLMPVGAESADWYAGIRAASGMVAMLALYFALAFAYPNGLGFGDVKLAGLIGLYLGWLSWNALFVAALGGLLIAGLSGTTFAVTGRGARAIAIRLAPCLVAAAVLALFVTAPLSSWYASLLPA